MSTFLRLTDNTHPSNNQTSSSTPVIEHFFGVPDYQITATSTLDNLDLDSRQEWRFPSLREYLWDLLELIEKPRSTSDLVINLDPSGFTAASLILSSVENASSEITIPQGIDLQQLKEKVRLSGKFVTYLIRRGPLTAEVIFQPSQILPSDIYISTPLTFPKNERGLLLTFDKNGWWNPLGGHIEKGETWQATLQREAQEEGGVKIDDIKVFGYFKVNNLTGQETSEFPPASQIPLTISRITTYQEEWTPMETSNRQFFTPGEAYDALKIRTDNNQMLQVYSYLLFLENKHLL